MSNELKPLDQCQCKFPSYSEEGSELEIDFRNEKISQEILEQVFALDEVLYR